MNGKHHAFWTTNGLRCCSNHLLPSYYAKGESSSSSSDSLTIIVKTSSQLQVKYANLAPPSQIAMPNQQLLVWFWHQSSFFFFFGFQGKATRAGDEKHRKKSTWPYSNTPFPCQQFSSYIFHVWSFWYKQCTSSLPLFQRNTNKQTIVCWNSFGQQCPSSVKWYIWYRLLVSVTLEKREGACAFFVLKTPDMFTNLPSARKTLLDTYFTQNYCIGPWRSFVLVDIRLSFEG